MVIKSKYKLKRLEQENVGIAGGNHGRLSPPIVSRGGSRKSKRMIRSGTRIRPGITASGGGYRRTRRTKRMIRSGTRIRPGITV